MKRYWDEQENKDTTSDLEKKYKMLNNQYQSLLKRYKEILLISKKLETIEQICSEPADSVAVLELQDRIKEVLNE